MSVAQINQPVAVPERVKRVMAMINRAVEAGERAPSNQDIADAIGASSVSAGVNILALLTTMGMIEVQRFGTGRIITVLSTGKATAYSGSLKPHWRERGLIPAKPTIQKTPEVQPLKMSDAAIQARQVHRDPCPRCGTRGDVGCSHGPAPLSMGAFW